MQGAAQAAAAAACRIASIASRRVCCTSKQRRTAPVRPAVAAQSLCRLPLAAARFQTRQSAWRTI